LYFYLLVFLYVFIRRSVKSVIYRIFNFTYIYISISTKHSYINIYKQINKSVYYCNRNLEDFVTWVDTSAIKKHVQEYKNEVRIFLLLQA